MKKPSQTNKGFTLIELLIASAISLIVLAAAFDAGINLQRVNIENQDLMSLQTSLTFSERILTQELERAGAGMSQLAVMAYNQSDSTKSAARLAITIQHISTAQEAACTSGTCSRLTIYSGDIQNALQIKEISANSVITTTRNDIALHWRNDTTNTHISNFLLVNPKAGVQCLIEDAATAQIVVSPGTSATDLAKVELISLTNLTVGTHTCDLSQLKSGLSFVMPMRATVFLTNGFQINAAQQFIPVGTHTPRLMYLPNIYTTPTNSDGSLPWLTISDEMEMLSMKYTIYNDADPTHERHRLLEATPGGTTQAPQMLFDPTIYTSATEMASLISENNLQPISDASTNAMVSLFNTEQTEAYSIPLLRRISQIEIGLLLRNICRDTGRHRCTTADNDLDDYGRQVRTITKRINPYNISLIALNEAIRG